MTVAPGRRATRPYKVATMTMARVWLVGLGIPAVAGIVAAIVFVQNEIDRGKSHRTTVDMRSLGIAIEEYSIDFKIYPVAHDIETLVPKLTRYISVVPTRDSWGHPYHVSSNVRGYEVVSAGKDGVLQGCNVGSTTGFNGDICFVDGKFTQWQQDAPD